jgi:hypothetical protein
MLSCPWQRWRSPKARSRNQPGLQIHSRTLAHHEVLFLDEFTEFRRIESGAPGGNGMLRLGGPVGRWAGGPVERYLRPQPLCVTRL